MAVMHCFTLALLSATVCTMVMGQYACPSGWTAKTGTPKCSGTVSAECTNTACCTQAPTPAPTAVPTPAPTQTCATYSVVWGTAQLAGLGCAPDKKFFDLKKLTTAVASSGDADVKAACCTPFTDALCSDWTLRSCTNPKTKKGTASAPGGGTTGMALTQSEFDGACCVTTPAPTPAPLTCATYSVVWGTAQLAGLGCAPDKKFFDLKKLTTAVASSGDADVKAACCTPFTDALCSDWTLSSCANGKFRAKANAAPGAGTDGKTMTQESFQATCCLDALLCSAAGTAEDASSAPRVAASIVAAMGVILVVMSA